MFDMRKVALTVVLALALGAIVYTLVTGEVLSDQVAVLERVLQRTQKQVAELKEVTVNTFEENVRRMEAFSQRVEAAVKEPAQPSAALAQRSADSNLKKQTVGRRHNRTEGAVSSHQNVDAKNRLQSFCAGWVGLAPFSAPEVANQSMSSLGKIAPVDGQLETIASVQPNNDVAASVDDHRQLVRQGGVMCVSSDASVDVEAMLKAGKQMKRQLENSSAEQSVQPVAGKQQELQPAVMWFGKADEDEAESRPLSDDHAKDTKKGESTPANRKEPIYWYMLFPQEPRPPQNTSLPVQPATGTQ